MQPSLVLGTTQEGNSFALSGDLFARHKHIMGLTGSGKSYLLASIFLSLFSMGIGVCLLDPHGDLARLVLSILASSDYFTDPRGYSQLWYVDFNRTNKQGEYAAAIPFNILAQPYQPHMIANNLLEAMHRAFPVSAATVNLDNIILMACLVLIQNKRPFPDINRLLLDKDFRDHLLEKVTDPLVKQFFALKFSDKVSASLVDSTLKRAFLMSYSPALRYPLSQQENKLNFRYLMDNRISLICNLSGLDDQTRKLLGGLVMVGLEQAFLSRATIPLETRHPYHVIADEFQLWMSSSELSFSRFTEECRKYAGVFYYAHQTLGQLPSGIASSLQNAITLVMKAGVEDSTKLVQNFYRPVAEKPEGLFSGLSRLFGLLDETPKNAFSSLTSKDEARALYENLQRSEALITVDGMTTRIMTNSIPPLNVDPAYLVRIEDTYANLLLTPVEQIEKALRREEQKPIIPFPTKEEQEVLKAKRAKRRVE